MKPHLNSAGAHAGIALAVDDMVGRVRIADGLQRHQGVAQFGTKPDRAAPPFLPLLALFGRCRASPTLPSASVTIDQRAIAISYRRAARRGLIAAPSRGRAWDKPPLCTSGFGVAQISVATVTAPVRTHWLIETNQKV